MLNSLIKSIFFYFDLALKLLFWSSISPWATFGSKWWSRSRERSRVLLAPQTPNCTAQFDSPTFETMAVQIKFPSAMGFRILLCFAQGLRGPTKTRDCPSWMGIFSRALLSGSEWKGPVPSSNLKDSTWKANEPLRVHQISSYVYHNIYIYISVYLLLNLFIYSISYVVVNPLKIWSSCKHCWLFLVLRIIELFGHDRYVYPPYTWGIIWHMVQYGKLMI